MSGHSDPQKDSQALLDDQAILTLLRSENPAEYDRGVRVLLKQFGGRVSNALRSRYRELLSEEEIAECLNESCFKAWRGAAEFDPTKGSLGAWLFVIAQHCAQDLLRGHLHTHQAISLEGFDLPERFDDDGVDNRMAIFLSMLPRAVDLLPTLQRSIIRADLAAGAEADNVRLALQLGTTQHSIRVSRYKAFKNLSAWFRKEGFDPSEFGV